MTKTIALQSNNQALLHRLHEQGYKVIDMYEAHQQRAIVDAYLYTTYHPDAFTAYNSVVDGTDSMLDDTPPSNHSTNTIMLNITNLEPDQILTTLERRLQKREWVF